MSVQSKDRAGKPGPALGKRRALDRAAWTRAKGPMKLVQVLACFLFLLIALWATVAIAQFSLVPVGHTNDGGYAEGLAVSSNFLYLANGTDGLRIYDLSVPASP